MTANVLMTIESITGLLGLAVATGLVFARFARPHAKILFSRNAVVAPYHGMTALEFRIANARTNQLIDVHASVLLSRMEEGHGGLKRKFHQLSLERQQVMFFPLHWVVVHPIAESSPLYGVTKQDFLDSDAEILILLTGFDETFSQTVHSRSSYKGTEVVWGAKFGNIFDDSMNGTIKVDLRKIHDIVPTS
jgi:inward rectifier potassium channel